MAALFPGTASSVGMSAARLEVAASILSAAVDEQSCSAASIAVTR
jgi:hypothetical protein